MELNSFCSVSWEISPESSVDVPPPLKADLHA